MIIESIGALAVGAAALIMLKPPTVSKPKSRSNFARDFLSAAERVEMKFIPPKFALAVTALETGNGTGRVFLSTNNLFSITAGASWRGVTYTAKTGFIFRVYNSLEESIADFVRLISTSSRYGNAYAAAKRNDAAGFFNGLQAAGYAGSDMDYAKKLLRTLEAVV